VYVCEKCKRESIVYEDIELCEAKHIGFHTLEDFRTYKALDNAASRATALRCNSSNEFTQKAEDEAYQKYFSFLDEHGISYNLLV